MSIPEVGGSDKMQYSDFGPTHKTGGAKHKINDLLFEIFHFDEI